MHSYVALLRAVNVGGTAKAPAVSLKAIAEGLGLQDVQTLLQSGNLTFRAEDAADILEARLERAFACELGLNTHVMVRSAADWSALIAANPFKAQADGDPSHLLAMVMKDEPRPEGVKALQDHPGPERIEVGDRVLYVVYPEGIGRSKLNAHSGWKKLGCPGTGRNWNTVLKLAERLG
jgi:uncharacterized protein (DUF1697 family)